MAEKGGALETLGNLIAPNSMAAMQTYGANKDAIAERQSSQTALSQLFGGYDPQTKVNWNGPRDLPPTSAPLPGAPVGPQSPLELAQRQQEYMTNRNNLMAQADPKSALSTARTMQIMGPMLNGLPDADRAMAMLDPKAYVEGKMKATLPTDDIRTLTGLRSIVNQYGPNSPQGQDALGNIEKKNYIPEKDPLYIQGKRADIAEKGAQTNLAGVRADQIKAGNIDDETMADMVNRYIETNDKTILTTLNRGTSGPVNLARFQAQTTARMHELGKSQRDIEMAGNGIKTAGSTLTAFAKGKQGDLTRSMNVATSHLMTLDALGEALDNGNMKLANDLKNKLSDQFGGVPIAGYEAAAPLVGDEVAKAILGGGSALADREKFAAPLSSARNQASRRAATDTFKGLLVGQLHGLKGQYKNGTGLDDFEEKLDPAVAAMLKNPQFAPGNNPTNPAPATPQAQPKITNDAAGQAAYSNLPSGSQYIDPTGVTRTKK